MMRTIETTGIVTPEHTITLTLPDDFPAGECQVVVSSEAKPPENGVNRADLPPLQMLEIDHWPEGFTVSREQIYGDDGR